MKKIITFIFLIVCSNHIFGQTIFKPLNYLETDETEIQGSAMIKEAYGYGYGKEAIKLIKKAAELGSTEGLCTLGEIYIKHYYNYKIKQDVIEGYKLIRKATEKGSWYAWDLLSELYAEQQSEISKKIKLVSQARSDAEFLKLKTIDLEGFEYLEKAAGQGNAEALYYLSLFYMYGKEGVKESRSKYFDLLKQSAQKGFDIAQIKLGIAYYYGTNVAKGLFQSFRNTCQTCQQS